jgi:3-hydroxyisobutyrate dehydrogenase
MASKPTVAVLGAGGTMGLPIARNLARAGFAVRAWNRSADKAQPLAQDGVELFDTPAEATAGAAVVLTMVADADAVTACMDGPEGGLSTAGAGAVWLQMSTIGERGTERCQQLARDRELAFIDAPVLGTKQPAEDGALVILGSGPDELRERMAPIFDVLGSRTMWVGEAGAGTKLKVAINSWIVTVVEGGAETIALAQGLGLDPALVFEALEGGPLDLPYLRMKGKAIIEGNFAPSFKLSLAAKDAGLVEESAKRRHLDLPLMSTVRQRLDEGAERHGDKDMCATYLTSARERPG